jgi:hypothetical protein
MSSSEERKNLTNNFKTIGDGALHSAELVSNHSVVSRKTRLVLMLTLNFQEQF